MRGRNILQQYRTTLAGLLVPIARAWVRYSPILIGKATIWKWFGWRAHQFKARSKAGFWVVGNSGDLIQNRLYWFGVWEPAISDWVSRHLRTSDVFVDVGANIGYYTLLGARLVGDAGHVVAIEPATQIYARLQGHLRINGVRNATALRIAVGRARARARLFMGPAANLGATSLIDHGAAGSLSEEVDVLPLCEIIPSDLVPRVSLIKIDVEGAESGAVAGLEPILHLLPRHVAILCEVDPQRSAALEPSAKGPIEQLQRFGFVAYRIRNVYRAAAYLDHETCPPEPLTERLTNRSDVILMRSLRSGL